MGVASVFQDRLTWPRGRWRITDCELISPRATRWLRRASPTRLRRHAVQESRRSDRRNDRQRFVSNLDRFRADLHLRWVDGRERRHRQQLRGAGCAGPASLKRDAPRRCWRGQHRIGSCAGRVRRPHRLRRYHAAEPHRGTGAVHGRAPRGRGLWKLGPGVRDLGGKHLAAAGFP